MRVLGIVGWSGSGKTTLMDALIPRLRAAGLSVSTVKHAHHGFDLDRPGKDTHRHREAGATEVLVMTGRRWALLHEIRDSEPEPAFADLLARMSPVDLVLVEGFKSHPFAKIEVHRPALGKPPLWPDDPQVVAVASDAAALPGLDRPLLPLADPAAVARFVLALGAAALERPAAAGPAPAPTAAGT